MVIGGSMTDTTNQSDIAAWQARQVEVNRLHVVKMERARYQAIAQRAERLAMVALSDPDATIEMLREALGRIAYGR